MQSAAFKSTLDLRRGAVVVGYKVPSGKMLRVGFTEFDTRTSISRAITTIRIRYPPKLAQRVGKPNEEEKQQPTNLQIQTRRAGQSGGLGRLKGVLSNAANINMVLRESALPVPT